MVTNTFFLVPRVVAEDKYFDVSLPEILRTLSVRGEWEGETEHHTIDEFGNDYTIVLKLNVNCRNPNLVAWSVALKMHRTRVDGVDYETKYPATDGQMHSGWHRHEWDSRNQGAEAGKIPIDFNDVTSREEFLIRSFSILRILLSATDYGNDQLSLA